MTLSRQQWETVLAKADPTTFGEVLAILEEQSLVDGAPTDLLEAGLGAGVIVERDDTTFGRIELSDEYDADMVDIADVGLNRSPDDDGGEASPSRDEGDASAYDDVDWSDVEKGVDPEGTHDLDHWMPASDKKPWTPGAPTENRRSWSDPGNWVSAEKAAEWEQMHPEIDGRAFILQDDGEGENYNGEPDPFLFIDYDDVVDEDTGEPTDEAKNLMSRLGMTYTDFSISGTGNHQIFRGSLSEDVRTIKFGLETGEVEIYDQRRVCIMTGKHVVGTPVDPQPVDEGALEDFVEEYGKSTSTVAREEWEPEYDRGDLDAMDETDDLQAIFDAIHQTEPRDIRLRSPVTEERADGTLSFDPTWANSSSGKRLGWSPEIGWIYRQGDRGLDALQVVALEEGIIRSVDDYPRGADWWGAVDALRDRGARLPQFNGGGDDRNPEDMHPLLEVALDSDEDIDADVVSALPLGQLETLPQPERKRAAKMRGLQWPSTREARDRLFETIAQTMRHEDETVVDAPTSLGKSHTIATTRWGAREDITGERPVVHLSATRDARDEAAEAAEEKGGKHFVLLSRHEACPVAAGDHDPEECQESDRQPITIGGTPASVWLDRQCEGKGLPFSAAHKHLADHNDQDAALPCGGGGCKAIDQWETLREGDWPLVIATHNFAHVPGLRAHANIVIDEEPDFTQDLTKERVECAITAYLQETDAPVTNWESFVSLSRYDGFGGDAAREKDALRDCLDYEPDREWYFNDTDAHTLAPALARAIFFSEERGNGRRVGKTPHEPPRLDDNADDDDSWNRVWVTVVLDEDNGLRTVRTAPDFSMSRSVIGMDAHPAQPVWAVNAVPYINTTPVLDPEERQLWRRYERGLRVVQVGDATRPLASGEYFKPDQVRALVEHLRAVYSDEFETGITTAAVEPQLREILSDAGVRDVDEMTMHYGEEKSRNDFGGERVGLIEGCIDPGDDFVVDLLAELDLEAEPETVDIDGELERAHGRRFVGPDSDTAAAILASVRENHTAQAAGRYARNPDDSESYATVFVRTDAMPVGFADIQVAGIEWVFTDAQRAIVEELRDATGRVSAREIADDVGCTKEHVRKTLARLEEMDAVQAFEGVGEHGATLYADDGLPNEGVIDLGGIANGCVKDSYTWSLAISAPGLAVTALTAGGGSVDDPEREVWDWRTDTSQERSPPPEGGS